MEVNDNFLGYEKTDMSSSAKQISKVSELCPEDVLLDRFRNDDICYVLRQFKRLGISKCDLVDFAKHVPTIYPWDEDYDKLRQNVNKRFVVFPWMIVMAQTEDQVVYAVKWARKYKVPVAIRSGSHCFESFSLIDGMVIDQSRRTEIQLLDDKVICQAGVLIGPLQLYLAKYNLAYVGGTCPNNCVSGLSLGGGIGFLTRKYGLSCDNIVEMRVVLADGKLVTVNKDKHSDLFWALCGAGNGNYGIVTQFIFKIFPIRKVTIFDLTYKFTDIAKVISIWQKWAPNVCDDLTSELDIYNDRVVITGQFLGNPKELSKELSYLKSAAERSDERNAKHTAVEPTDVKIEYVSFPEACRHFAGRGYWSPFFKNKSAFVKESIPDTAIEIIKKYMRRAGDEDRLELDAFGGQVSNLGTNSSFYYRNVAYWMHFQSHWRDQRCTKDKLRWVREFYDEMEPYLTGAYINVPDLDLGACYCKYCGQSKSLNHALHKYYGSNVDRLKKIKTKYDPTNFFRYPQSIPPL